MKTKKPIHPKPHPLLHVYLIEEHDDFETSYHYVAPSAARALSLFIKDHCDPKLSIVKYQAECPKTTITQCADDQSLTITDLAEYTGKAHDKHYTHTMAEWAKECGEGALAASDPDA